MFFVNIGLGVLLLVAAFTLLRQPACPRCGRLWPQRTHVKRVWLDKFHPVPRPYRLALLAGDPYPSKYIQIVIQQVTYRCQHDDCGFTWNQFERVTEVVEPVE